MRRYPFSFILLTVLGILCAIPGLISIVGFGAVVHPVLDDPMAGLAFIVSAAALIGSGAFPLVLEKLKEDDER
jgi:Mg/Co/Ni transporter MgtE